MLVLSFPQPEFGFSGSKSGPKWAFLTFPWVCHFLEIAFSDSIQQCLTLSRGKTHKEILGGKSFGPKEPQNSFFLSFSKFSWLVLLKIAYSGSLQQWLSSSRNKTHKKTFCAKIGPEIRVFFTIFSSLVHEFSYKLHEVIAWTNV